MSLIAFLRSTQSVLFFGMILMVSQVHAVCLNNLVREAPDDRYEIQGETLQRGVVLGDTIKDLYTGLVWQRCALGQTWSLEKSRCQIQLESQRIFTWQEAVSVVDTINAVQNAPGNDRSNNAWRLPTKNELASLVDRACTGPAINEKIFPDTPISGFWTSTPARYGDGVAWQVDFTTGTLVVFDMSYQKSVRLVKSPN